MLRRIVLLASMAAAAATLLVPAGAFAASNFSWKPLGKVTNLGSGSLDSLSCPSAALCVAGGSKAIWVSTAPTSNASKWKRVALSQPDPSLGASYIYEVSCPTVNFCAVGDSNTNVITSTNPGSGKLADWTPRQAPVTGYYAGIGGLFCSSATLCAASDYSGGAITTVNPLGGVWAAAKLSSTLNAGIYDVACAGKTCVSVQSDKFAWVTSDASAQPAVWRKLALGNARRTLNAVACKNEKTCMATGYGPLRVSTNAATGGAATWKSITLPGVTWAVHANCTAVLCTVTDGSNVWWSTTPQVARSWKKSASGSRTILSDTACPTAKLCFASNVGGQLYVGRR